MKDDLKLSKKPKNDHLRVTMTHHESIICTNIFILVRMPPLTECPVALSDFLFIRIGCFKVEAKNLVTVIFSTKDATRVVVCTPRWIRNVGEELVEEAAIVH